jgi:predicted DCC family thiol-disulfide oxidoreductase YuxK
VRALGTRDTAPVFRHRVGVGTTRPLSGRSAAHAIRAGAGAARMTLVFYDGVCGLCDRFVRFLLARDPAGRLRFAPLQGETARRELPPLGLEPADLDSVVVIAGWRSPAPRVLTRSRAVLHTVRPLGTGWRLLAATARLVPRPIADAVYDAVARRRYRMFGRFDACPLPHPDERARFLE